MDELNLSEIEKKLNDVFSSGERLVFWYDTTGVFEDSVDDLFYAVLTYGDIREQAIIQKLPG